MKKFYPFLVLVLLSMLVNGQPIRKDMTTIPSFDIIQADGSHYKASELKSGMPVMIVYFDPGCEHCEKFISDLKNELNAFDNVQIVMVSCVAVDELKSFVKKVCLPETSNVRIGTEGKLFTVRYHYDVVQFPFLALHDKNGQLFATYESIVPSAGELARMFAK